MVSQCFGTAPPIASGGQSGRTRTRPAACPPNQRTKKMVGTAQMRLCPPYGLSQRETRNAQLVGVLKSQSDEEAKVMAKFGKGVRGGCRKRVAWPNAKSWP